MRTENIKVTFKIPIPVDTPDLNGVIYSKEVIRNAYKNVKDIPIEIPCSEGQFLPIGVAQEVELKMVCILQALVLFGMVVQKKVLRWLMIRLQVFMCMVLELRKSRRIIWQIDRPKLYSGQ